MRIALCTLPQNGKVQLERSQNGRVGGLPAVEDQAIPPDRSVNLVGFGTLSIVARPAGVPVAHPVVDPVMHPAGPVRIELVLLRLRQTRRFDL